MPPCNCHPPFPRPEPFSPLPRPGKTPDWGKWIRDRLAEKGALLAFPSVSAFPDPGAQPNVYGALDTGTLYRWDGAHYQVLVDPSAANDVLEYEDRGRFPETGERGKLYIAANTGDLYRWGGGDYVELLEGKADKAVPAAGGNLAALTQDGNLADSGKKPSDFADAANTYTKAETDEAIDRVAAYYITYDAAGNPFPTYAALANAQTVYSGGKVRVPTRNDYCVVLADETHDNAEYRYIYAVADGETTGSWQPQFPVEGVMTVDQTVTKNSQNPVSGGGVWSAIWGALASLPSGFSSLYDWCVAQLAGKASKSDATLTERGPNHDGFSAWIFTPSEFDDDTIKMKYEYGGWQPYTDSYGNLGVRKGDAESTMLTWVEGVDFAIGFTATRTALQGYQLGSQSDKPLASEAEAEALRTEVAGKLDKRGGTFDTTSISFTDLGVGVFDLTTGKRTLLSASDRFLAHRDDSGTYFFSAPPTSGTLALAAGSGYEGNLAALDASGNPTDAGWTAGELARYSLVTKTIDNGAVSLDDRAINAVAVSSSLASLTVNFPTATSGKARDFAMRLNIASGVTAPEIAWPQGVTLENDGGKVPEIADGGTGGSSTILYFSETENNGTTAKFLVKGETLTAIAQA